MVREKYRIYVHWGLTIFLIILCSILAFFFLLRFDTMISAIRGLNDILAPIISGLVIAYLLSPVADMCERLMDMIPGKKSAVRGKVTRGLAVLISILFLLAILAFMVGTILPQMIDTVKGLILNIDNYVTTIESWIEPVLEVNPAIRQAVLGAFERSEAQVKGFMESDLMVLLGTVTSGVVEVGRFIYNFVLGVIVSVYVLAARTKIVGRSKKLLFAFVPRAKATTVLDVARQTNRMFKGFIVGKVLDSSIVGVLCFLGMTLMRLPYPLFISVIVAVTNIIPYFGPFLGAIPSALLILIISPTKCLIFVLFILFLQQLDGNFIGPKVLGNTTGLSSMGVLFSILVGGGLFGLVGMIVSVPICGVLYSIIKRFTEAMLKKRGMPVATDLYITADDPGALSGGGAPKA